MQNRAEDGIREANKAFLDSAWNFLNFRASEEDREFYVDENLGEIEDYLYAGADANVVARSGIWVGHLPTVKLAFRFNVTQNLIHHALVTEPENTLILKK